MFSELLKKAMIERNMTQTQLSALSGIGKSSISQYLSGKNVPTDKAKKKLADAPDGCTLKNVTVKHAAKLLGKSKQFVRVSLQRGVAPFGFAVKMSGDKYSYHISPKKFFEYAGVI